MTLKNNTKKLLILCYLYFGLIGFVLGMRTSVFFFVQESYLTSYSPLANMILISGIAMQISLYFSGIFIQKIGYKTVLNIGMAAFALPVVLMYFINSFTGFVMAFTILMIAYGITVIILNLYVSVLNPERKSNNLMLLHLFFCLGALAGPKCISYLTSTNLPWQTVMALSGIPLLIVFAVTVRTKSNEELTGALKSNKETPHQSLIEENAKTIPKWFTAVLIIVFMCSQIWEYGIGTWFVIFISSLENGSQEQGALLLTLFYAMYPVVRIVLSKTIQYFNLLNLMIGSFFVCAFFGSLAVLLNAPVLFSLTGLGVGVFYPAFMSYIQGELGQSATKRIGYITMVGGLMQYVAIWSIGLISDTWNIQTGFHSMVIYLIIGTLGLGIIKVFKSKDTLVAVKTAE